MIVFHVGYSRGYVLMELRFSETSEGKIEFLGTLKT